MKILHIFASKTWGGGEQYVLELGKKLIEKGHNVFFISKKSPIIANKVNNIFCVNGLRTIAKRKI
jgi:hypothetical protein